MRKLREVLRLKHERTLSNRKIGVSLEISHATVAADLRRPERAGVEWPLPDDWDDVRLEEALFPPTAHATVARPLPDWPHVYRELGRHKGVTFELLWLEYKQIHPDGYQYTPFPASTCRSDTRTQTGEEPERTVPFPEVPMRAKPDYQSQIYYSIDIESWIPEDHALRGVKARADAVLSFEYARSRSFRIEARRGWVD